MSGQLTLSSDHALRLCELLLREPHWRQRVVEQIQPVSSDHYRVARSYQFEFTPDLVEKAELAEFDAVHGAIVPVGWFDKRPLLDLDILDHEGSSQVMLERQSIAGILADTLHTWMAACSIPANTALTPEELESINVASLATWTMYGEPSEKEPDAADEYIHAGTSHHLPPEPLHEFLRTTRRLANLAQSVLGKQLYATQATTANTALNSLVLAPYLYPTPSTSEALVERMRSLQCRIEAILELASKDREVAEFATFLLNCGLRWPALVQMVAPVGAPFIVKVSETRVSGHKSPRKLVHGVDLATCRSYHLLIRSPAPEITVRKAPTTAAGQSTEPGLLFEGARLTRELFATYTSQRQRPTLAELDVRFRLSTPMRAVQAFGAVLAVSALAYALAAPSLEPQLGSLLTVPTAVVTGLLLTQGPRVLSDFLRPGRYILVVVNILLWLVVLVRLDMANFL